MLKQPRIYHLPWSEGLQNDDKRIDNLNSFTNQEIEISIKMDGGAVGGNYDGTIQTKTVDGTPFLDSGDWFKSYWINRYYLLNNRPFNVKGELLYYQHSIEYINENKLPSAFLGYTVWNNDICLSCDDRDKIFSELKIKSVPILYRGIYDEKLIRNIEKELDFDVNEGYVIRVTRSFKLNESSNVVAKFVREGHVQTDVHWTDKIRKNPKLYMNHFYDDCNPWR